MKKRILTFGVTLLSMFAIFIMNANSAIPFILSKQGMFDVMSWCLIAAGFLVEVACMRMVVKKSIGTVALVTFVMNAVSTLLGLHGAEFFARLAPSGAIWLFMVPIVFDVTVEMFVALICFPGIQKRKLVGWLIIANAISIALGLIAT